MVELMSEWGDLAGMIVACILTIMVLSYLIGDNALFRLASHIFIGLTAGFVTVLILYGVIWKQLLVPLWDGLFSEGGTLNIAVPLGLVFGFILLAARSSAWGRPVVAYLVGVGAATAIGGALLGTIVPQVNASANLFAANLVIGAVVLIGTVTTLVYFNFRARAIGDQPTKRAVWIEVLGLGGQFFVAVTFGVLFAAVFTASLTALVQRLHFILLFIWDTVYPFFSLT